MHIRTYSTSMEEIFSCLHQGLADDSSLQKTSHAEKAELIQEEWLVQLEEAFRKKGFKFGYSMEPAKTTYYDNGSYQYFGISAPMYIFEVER